MPYLAFRFGHRGQIKSQEGSLKKLVIAVAAMSAFAGSAHAQDASSDAFTGARVEARIGWETPTVSGDGDVYKLGQAVSFGAEAGYDFKLGSTVTFGPYATFETSGVKACDAGDCLRVKSNIAGGGQVGVAVSDNTMIYGKLGYSQIRMNANSGNLSSSENFGGVGGALGVEFGVTEKAYARIEGGYSDYGNIYGINFQRRFFGGSLGYRF